MKIRKIICAVLTLAIMTSCLVQSVYAIDSSNQKVFSLIRATGRFNVDIPGKSTVKASTDFPMEVGETVAINAVYTPQSASVDFGLLAPDGLFYPINTTDGSFDETIKVDQRGHYTLVIRNNSTNTINVSGYVNY